jgi:hypothetical protein
VDTQKPNDLLYDKLSAEFGAFADGLKAKPKEDILAAAFEKAWKEEILTTFENGFFSDAECAALMKLPNALDYMYREWLSADSDYLDGLRDCITGAIARETGEPAYDETSRRDTTAREEPENGGGYSYEERIAAEQEPTAQALNGALSVGDWVVVNPGEDYGLLIGQVTAIDKLGAEEHDTDNMTDDVHVSFINCGYSEKEEASILVGLRKMRPDLAALEDFALDDVIMAPESLISLAKNEIDPTDARSEAIYLLREDANGFLRSYFDDMENELIDRVEQNYADYTNSLQVFGKSELIDMAAKIHATSDAYSYMTAYREYSDEELRFYLQFQNPLEIVADAWHERQTDVDEVSFAMDGISEHMARYLTEYPLMSYADAPRDESLRRFMHVDVFDFLGKVSGKTLVHYPNDWNIDKETLYEAASSDNRDDRRLVWHVCKTATHLNPERDVFVKGSGAYAYMTDYHQNDPDMLGYIIEVTGRDGKGAVIGNVFEVGDYAEYAKHIRETALPPDNVTLRYSDEWGVNAGKTITVSRGEYDEDRRRLMSESGNVIGVKFNPASESQLRDVLRDERAKRMSYPLGSRQAHIKKVSAKIDAVRKAQEQEQSEPAQAAKLSPFDRSLNRGKAKTAEYKAQKASEPVAAEKKKRGERS